MRICISVVSNRDHKLQFVGALYALTQHIFHQGQKYGIAGHMLSLGAGHSCLSRGRQHAIDLARKNDATHLFSLDDDMVFPPDILQSLLARRLPVVGANYVMKDQENAKFVASDADGNRISSQGKTGVEEVARLGMGVTLIEMAAIKHVPAPHFEVLWNKNGYISEDNYFCDKLRAQGVKIYVDHDASKNIGHVGDYVYSAR